MIYTFTAKNFHSIDEEVTIDFVVDDKTPRSDKYIHSKLGTKLSVVQALVGPNAAGKTTALRALTFIQWLMLRSFTSSHFDRQLPFRKFAGNSNNKKPTELSVTFEMKKEIYTYSVVLSKTRIITEDLNVKSLTTKRMTTKRIFNRQWSAKTKSYIIEDYSFGLPDGYWRSAELSQASLIAAAGKFGHEYAGRIMAYWKNLESNVEDYYGYMRGYRHEVYDALRYFNRDADSKKIAENEVRKYADFGISHIGNNGTIKHKFGDIQFEIEIDEESSGTRHYLGLSKMIDVVLRRGGIAVIDEFDAYLHPNMFASLLKKFFDPKINKKHGQLLITTHNLAVFTLLDAKYQLLLTSKENGATKVKRIKDRADANHLIRYIEGAYGALPKIDNEHMTD